jgi:hypothetical protein
MISTAYHSLIAESAEAVISRRYPKIFLDIRFTWKVMQALHERPLLH